jgi:flagella basal body P-ring formation protein FlgA
MMRELPMKAVLLPILLLAASPAGAEPADLAAIAGEAARFAQAPVMPLDPRLRLAPCPQPPALSWAAASRESVLVQCPVPGGWRLFVPLAHAPQSAVAPAIARGDPVTIVLGGEGFAVSQQGEALDSGPVGAWIRVRSLAAKGQFLRARVLRPGQVGIPLP